MYADHGHVSRNDHLDGYRGIWFRLGQFDGEYGDKYAGGLGTYTMKHVPMAIHDAAVGRTYFTYGGRNGDAQGLLVMVGAYDHDTHSVSRPTVVDTKPEPDPSYDSDTVVDPHDNATIALDGDGHVIVFVAGRSRRRPGRVYRSETPHDITSFSLVVERDFFAYPQPWWIDDEFVLLYTIYDEAGNRELFWERTPDGTPGTRSKLAGIGGQYQVSECQDGVVFTAFNWHPDGTPDRRTNLYVAKTADGITWQTPDGTPIEPPIRSPDHHSLVRDYHGAEWLVYLNDIAVDSTGRPVVLYVTSAGHEPGPGNDPRRWELARWTGSEWRITTVTHSDHNYDSGSLFLRKDGWYVLGPTEPGPQPYGTGGEIGLWRSTDGGESWSMTTQVTRESIYNHTYVRRPRHHISPFDAFWADGNALKPSNSRLFVGDLDGAHWQLPTNMDSTWVELEDR